MGILTFHDNFRRRIGSLLEGRFTDAILLVEGVEIPVHRNILAVQSEYFSDLFDPREDSGETADQRGATSSSQALTEVKDTEEFSNSNNQSIVEVTNNPSSVIDNNFELKNTKVEVVRAVLDYFYRGEYDFDESVETHLLALELARQFKLKDLEETLISNLVAGISVENYAYLYNMKMHYKNAQLENSCSSFLKENGEEIAKSDNFTKLTRDSLLSLLNEDNFAAAEIDIFRAAERWAGVNKPNKITVKDIVKKIRLATMSQRNLLDVVKCSKELPFIEIVDAIHSISVEDTASTNFRKLPPTHDPVPDLNVAQSSLGAEVLSGSVTGGDLISGSSGCTSHKVGGKPDCISVKLDKTYRLNALQLLLDSSDGRSYKYQVEVSVNEREWLKVVDHSNYWCRSHQFLMFNPRAVRFIRMTGTDEGLNVISFAALYSNEECPLVKKIQVASTNVVLESRGANVTGRPSKYSGFSCKPIHCIDGNENSFAVMDENSPLTITLGQPHWLSSLRVEINAYGNSYTIESSPDGESWQPVGDKSEEKEGRVWRTFDFSSRVVLHFRVTMKKIKWEKITLFHFESPARTTAVTN